MRKKSAHFIREHWPTLFWISFALSLVVLVVFLWATNCISMSCLSDDRINFLITTLLALGALSFPAKNIIEHYREKDPQHKMITVAAIAKICSPPLCAVVFAYLFLRANEPSAADDLVCPVNNNQVEQHVAVIRSTLSQYVSTCLERGTAQQESDWETVNQRIINQQSVIRDSVLHEISTDSACRNTLRPLLDQKLAESSDTVTQRVDELLTLTRAIKGMERYSQGQVQAMMERFSIMNDAVVCDPSNRKLCLLRDAGMYFSAANPGGDKLNTIVRLKKEDNIISQIIIR